MLKAYVLTGHCHAQSLRWGLVVMLQGVFFLGGQYQGQVVIVCLGSVVENLVSWSLLCRCSKYTWRAAYSVINFLQDEKFFNCHLEG